MATQHKGWEVFKLYNGSVVIGFDKYGTRTGARHSYWLKVPVSPEYPEGMRLIPGVTGVSGLLTEAASGLSPWAAWMAVRSLREDSGLAISEDQAELAISAHTRSRDTAAVKGTAVHKFIEMIVKDEPVSTEDKKKVAYKYAASGLRELSKAGITVVDCERKVFSRIHNFCGTTDMRVRLPDGSLAAIVDAKTSKAFRLAHAMQIAAYAFAYEEEAAFIGEPVTFSDAGVLLCGAQSSIKWLSHTMRMPGREALERCFTAFLGLLAVKTNIPDIKNFGRE